MRLRHLAEVNPSTPEFDALPDEAIVPFLPLEAVWPNGRLDTGQRRIKGLVANGYTRFREGDILVPKITPTFQADRTAIATPIGGGVAAGTTELHVVRTQANADSRYVRYLLSSKPFLSLGEASMTGVAGQKRVPDDCLRDLVVPVLDSVEQRRIADFLDAETDRIDALIAKKLRVVELLLMRFRSARFELLTTSSGSTPMPLRRLVHGVVGGAWGSDPGADEVDVPCVRIADFDRIQATTKSDIPTVRSLPLTQARRLALDVGDLLLEKSGGGDSQPVGCVVAFRGPVGGPVVCSNFIAVMRPSPWIKREYLRHVFAAIYDAGLSAPHIKQTTGIQNLDIGSFLSQTWPIALTEHQVAVAEKLDRELDRVSAARTALERQVELLAEHRKALITVAVTGELPIPA